MLGGKKSGTPIDDPTGWQSSLVRKNDKGGQVVGFTTQTVSYPGAHARKSGKNLPGVHHEIARAVQGCLALHRVNETHVIHAGGEFGQKITHPDARLAMLAEFPKTRPAVSGLGSKELKFASRVKGRTRPSLELGFVVVGIDMAQTTRAENLDDPLGPRREVSAGG